MKHPIERSRYIQVYQRQLEEEMEMIENGRRWRKAKAKRQGLSNPLRVAVVIGALFAITLLFVQLILT